MAIVKTAGDDGSQQAIIDGENQFSDPVSVVGAGVSKVAVGIVGDAGVAVDGTVHIQMKRPDWASTEYIDVANRTAADILVLELIGSWDVRAGVKTGNFGSNDVQVEIVI
jgi:hypothetical protein